MFLFAWLIGEGIIVYRWVKKGAPPTPGALLLPSGLFLALAILAEYQPARATATACAYAVDLAVLLQVVGKAPAQVTGWPPPQTIPQDVILPGGTSTSGSGTAATPGSGQGFSQGSAISEAEQAGGFLPGTLFGQLP